MQHVNTCDYHDHGDVPMHYKLYKNNMVYFYKSFHVFKTSLVAICKIYADKETDN